jgi:phosphoglycerate dehydrogenase-like enzyme
MTLKLLLSPIATERLRKRIDEIAQRHRQDVTYVDVNSRDFEVALITREITGLSTKHQVLPATQRYYDALLESPSLRWVHIHAAGVDRPVYQQLMARGVRVTPSAGTNAKEVAQTALGGILALARKFPKLAAAQRLRLWAPTMGEDLPRQLAGQTALVIGWGPIGQQLAKYLNVLDVNVIIARHDASKKADDFDTVGYVEINGVLPKVDWVVLCCPLTDVTRCLIGEEQLRLMPRHSHLVNVSRGEIVDERTLEDALLEKQIAGAFLDVFAHEPLHESSPLWDIENVIITPHNAGFSDGNAVRVDEIFLQLLETRLS